MNPRYRLVFFLTSFLLGAAWEAEPALDLALSPPAEPSIPPRAVSITDFGAVADGHTLNTSAFEKAMEAVSAKGGGRVMVPPGVWRTGPMVLRNRVDLHLERGALIQFSDNREDYPLVETSYEGRSGQRCQSPISGQNLEHIAITGQGILDGAGQAWRPVKQSKMTAGQWTDLLASGGVVNQRGDIWYPSTESLQGGKDSLRPVMLSLVNCRKVLLEGVTFQNSPAWCLHPLMCEDVTLRQVTVRNPWYSQNGDGLDLDSCRNALVEECSFDVGDDAICLKSGRDAEGRRRGKPTENVIVRHCVVYHGHGGFVVGSEMSGGVRNIQVSDCTFIGTDVGLRFKSTRGRGGVVENILIERIRMMDIPTEAIRFNLFYGGDAPTDSDAASAGGTEERIPPVTEETPAFRNIVIRNIVCRGARRAALFRGLPEMPLESLRMENVHISADTGILVRDARDLNLSGIQLDVRQGPALALHNASQIVVNNLQAEGGSKPTFQINGSKTRSVRLQGLSGQADAVEIGAEVPQGSVRLE